MDSDTGVWIIIFTAMMAAVLVFAYIYNGTTSAPPMVQPNVYYDRNMQIYIPNGQVYWQVPYAGLPLAKRVFIYNPNEYSINISLSWQTFPPELAQYCQWNSSDILIIEKKEIIEVTLYLTVTENPWLGTSSFEGDCLTQIKAERVK
jgi:hypothetical protein